MQPCRLCSADSERPPTFTEENQEDVSKRRNDIINPLEQVHA
jgi:hypothetical protein